ncbi:glycosyltransferase family 10 domain-containing protein [Butyrivibrio sp. AE2032]|uniref:glycosyltransferase family 10 domain-containing protein n=1 Tax=Butyrivibrio sp. AE2032 TaxID=1458463 RepID=UPI000555A563|nr:glycosyltransferase family 10 [Butyrivibrio sp. AE2032]
MNISYKNWWDNGQSDKWFKSFFMHYFGDCDRDIRLYSVFGNPEDLDEPFDGIKIFYSSENLEPPKGMHAKEAVKWQQTWMNIYDNYAMDNVDISLGYGYQNNEKYLRFPAFIRFTFLPDSNLASIRKRIEEINLRRVKTDASGIAIVARHDQTCVRSEICDRLEKEGFPITYAGKWRNNTDKLWNKYHNHKVLFLTDYEFNICSENMNAEGYCTEKLHECFRAGTIPIYYGSDNNPEPGMINHDAVIFWDDTGNNDNTVALVQKLSADKKEFMDYCSQTRYRPEMADYVFDTMNALYDKVSAII